MAWSWSHTQEAYDSAQRNLQRKKKEWLEIVFAEWRAARIGTKYFEEDNDGFDQKKYNRALAYAKKQTDETLSDQIWEWMSEYATCDNGGHRAWCCPSGCHTVSFHDEIDEENDDPRAIEEWKTSEYNTGDDDE